MSSLRVGSALLVIAVFLANAADIWRFVFSEVTFTASMEGTVAPARIYEDGEFRGYTPLSLWRGLGQRNFVIRAPEGVETDRFELFATVAHYDKGDVNIHAAFQPPFGQVKVRPEGECVVVYKNGMAYPFPGAEVFVDGWLVGVTPFIQHWPVGTMFQVAVPFEDELGDIYWITSQLEPSVIPCREGPVEFRPFLFFDYVAPGQISHSQSVMRRW